MIVTDPALNLVVLVVVGLVGLAASLTLYSVTLHVRNVNLSGRIDALSAAWRPIILDIVDGSPPSIGPLDVAPRDRLLFVDLLLEYARALKYPERERVERLAGPYLADLVPLLEDRDPFTRAGALEALSQLGFWSFTDKVIAGIDDPADVVAFVAARQLASRRQPEHLPVLLGSLGRFDAWSTEYLAGLLTSFGAGAGDQIRQLAVAPATPARIRSVAVQALIRLHDLPAADAAAALVESETDTDLQADLVRLVGRLGHPKHLDNIRELVDAEAPHVRAEALTAIASLTDGARSDIELLERGVEDPSPWVALHAAEGLKAVGRIDLLTGLIGGRGPLAALAGEVLADAS